jgi:hypothetical protein
VADPTLCVMTSDGTTYLDLMNTYITITTLGLRKRHIQNGEEMLIFGKAIRN